MIDKVANSGKSLSELIADGHEKFATVTPASGAAAAVTDEAQEKKEAVEKEPEDDCDPLGGDGMVGLFDDDEY